jgi:hypothetical protein
LAGIAGHPQLAWMAAGLPGKLLWLISKCICMGLASVGLVVLNVGTEKLLVIMAESNFDGSWESAQKLIDEVHRQGRELTDAEKKAIDEPVKAAFRRFGRWVRKR